MTRFKNEWTQRVVDLESLNAALIANVEAKQRIMDSLVEENAELRELIKEAEEQSRKRLALKKSTWLKMVAALAK